MVSKLTSPNRRPSSSTTATAGKPRFRMVDMHSLREEYVCTIWVELLTMSKTNMLKVMMMANVADTGQLSFL